MLKRKTKKLWDRLLIAFLVFIFLSFAVSKFYEYAYKGRIYAGVMVGSIPVGGLTFDEAQKAIQSQIDALHQNGLVFVFRDRTVNAPMVVATTEDPDLSYELIRYDISATAQTAFSYGRTGNVLKNIEQVFLSVIDRSEVEPVFEWREQDIKNLLKENLKSLEHPAQDSHIVIKNWKPEIVGEKSGIIFNYDRALMEAHLRLSSLEFSPIALKLEKDIPEFTQEDVEPLLSEAQKIIYTKGITVQYEKEFIYWPATSINDLIEVRKSNSRFKSAELGISKEKLSELLKPLESRINIEPQEPRFALENGKVVEFKSSANGRKLSLEDTWKAWEDLLFNSEEKQEKLEPVVLTIEPKQDVGDLNDLGIIELLGVGKSNFGGSPKNRRHNIKVGADSVNGTLIPPDEEFSLLKTIGKVDKDTGYLPELVIKGNETIPEYGGGLCQIGTTTFRGTLAAGLPITLRRPHSYTVSYYFDEQHRPGKDATIYDPWPDFKFLNDTHNHVLILTRIEGSDLFFEYWGTKDGRIIEESEVSVWGRVAPPETKYVETLSLPVGEKKCTETPHAGMKASFDYTITYPDGEVKKETFLSQYKPWQEVCLIGVEKLSEEVDEESLDIDEIQEDELSNGLSS
ncbi:VanW family protein [Patescibacteria group bacterium]|nr:VanW family protein [Patescibacteria group bacterium]